MRTEWQNEFKLLSIVISTKYMVVLFLLYMVLSGVEVFKSINFLSLPHLCAYGSVVVVLVTQSCLILCDPMDCSPPRLLCPWDFLGKDTGVDCHFLLQGSFQPRDWTQVSCTEGRFFTDWATREAHGLYWQIYLILVNPNLTSKYKFHIFFPLVHWPYHIIYLVVNF